MFAGKPIIGIAGGIGGGKSLIADLFGELGCLVISSDELIGEAYAQPAVKNALRGWWGDEVFGPDGEILRRAIASRIFADSTERRRLEHLLHPLADTGRKRIMAAAATNPQVAAFIWDTPLLFESGLNLQADAVVFVEAPRDLRLRRLQVTRGWDEAELARRENSQWPLDRKREISDYVIRNTADAGDARSQVRDVLSRILARSKRHR